MAQPKKLTATREELYEMYWGKQMSARQIAERFSISEEAVRRQMVKYGLPRRSRSEILKYARMSFGGDPLEGAYLIGLRAGDIHARRRATNTVGVNVTTTHPAMCELFEKTFGKYGHVRKYPVKGHLGYEWYLYCDLDKSFEFLIDKPIEVPSGDNLYAFLAAYVDCEGTWSFSKQVNKIVFHFWIKSQDKALLKQIKEKLEEEGLHPNHLKLVKKGQHRHEESENRNHVKIRYRRDYWQFRICKQNDILSLARKLTPFARHREKMERMRLMLKAKEREWSTHGNEIKELIKQTDEEVERWVKEAENEYKRKHAHD